MLFLKLDNCYKNLSQIRQFEVNMYDERLKEWIIHAWFGDLDTIELGEFETKQLANKFVEMLLMFICTDSKNIMTKEELKRYFETYWRHK